MFVLAFLHITDFLRLVGKLFSSELSCDSCPYHPIMPKFLDIFVRFIDPISEGMPVRGPCFCLNIYGHGRDLNGTLVSSLALRV